MQESAPGTMLSIFKKIFSKSPESTSKEAAPTPSAPTQKAGPPPDAIAISLKSVVATMPDNLKKRLEKKLSGDELIHLDRQDVMRQLATGAVKIPFSEVVRMAPNTFSSPDTEMLATQISIPLSEILPKIKALPRRAEQKVVAVPEDLAPVFGPSAGGSKSKNVEVAPVAPAPSAAPAAPAPAAAPMSVPKPPTPPVPPPSPAPQPAAAKGASKPAEEAYVPPPPKPLEPQAAISFKPAGLETPPAQPPAPASPPLPPPPAFAPAPPTPVAAAPKAAPAPAAPASAPGAPSLGFGEIFGQPDKLEWTPQEVVDKAGALRGVAGALITTNDGLPVASRLPEGLSGNVVAAFVPQMYTRIVQYTRDLKFGDAKHLTILIENVPLQIFKSGSYYFTVLGRANENLPKPQLTAISAALSRQGQL